MVKLHVYVEGGAKRQKDLNIACRKGFKRFVSKAGIDGGKIQFIPGFGRETTFTMFRKAFVRNADCLLLIDSETALRSVHECDADGRGGLPWEHLKLRRGDTHWKKPGNADSSHCHFMVECMENWFLADKEKLKIYFGGAFQESALPGNSDIESVRKPDIQKALKKASAECAKGRYDKGDHSFGIIELLDPELIGRKSPWARRFIDTLKTRVAG
ncbi:MAG: DUF4276 family protein [Desulfovibrio sp.]|jgi:hypothetical protein|nr:DUF4276 family protein [Desulfovibrio sp.]